MELAEDERMESSVRGSMRALVERISKIDDKTEQARMLRRGLDHAYAAVARYTEI